MYVCVCVFRLEERQRKSWHTSVHGVTESDTTQQFNNNKGQ